MITGLILYLCLSITVALYYVEDMGTTRNEKWVIFYLGVVSGVVVLLFEAHSNIPREFKQWYKECTK